MKRKGCLMSILVGGLILSALLFFSFSFLGRYGDKNPEAMPDEQVEQYVRDRIPLGSPKSVVQEFIESEKEEWPYYSTPKGNFDSYYTLQYAKGTYELWIGGFNYCQVFVYLDKNDRVSGIKLRRWVGPWP